MDRRYTDEDLWRCADRELKHRHRVYANLVAKGNMTKAERDRQIGMMQEIRDIFKEAAQAGDLFGREGMGS